ncbi:hypothetical protein [Levilactobacillus parabrevis]|uniref:hypothetical protein n=1 Tax=Levilactobacillus parabrevis TaxID=357278 RepID=UPI0037577365
MQKTQLVKALSALSVALFVGGTVTTVDASAKAVKTKGFRVTKITKNTHYKKSAYTKKSPKSVTLYSSRYLTKHTTSKNTKTFYSTQSVRVKKSTGKTATYRYVKNAKGSVKGWIWTGNLKGKQGKVTKVSNKTVIAPTTNVKVARKTTTTALSNPTNSKDKLRLISDAVSNKDYKGAKNVAKLRDTLNKLATILHNHPQAWDKTVGYETAYGQYIFYYISYVNQVKPGHTAGKGATEIINEDIYQVQWAINEAKY